MGTVGIGGMMSGGTPYDSASGLDCRGWEL